MRLKYKTPTGMHDILSNEWCYFEKIENLAKELAKFYNFERIETPILEEEELFTKGLGISTDIVQKEMFVLTTKGEDKLCLRPEGTAPVCRAYLQEGMRELSQPVKLWYFGPFFRYEKPQAGRYRQFWQLGFETIGSEDPVSDVEILQLSGKFLEELGIKNFFISINTLGDQNCRPYYKKALTQFFKGKVNQLCQNCRKRLKENVLRILDCKEEKCQRIIKEAPQVLDYLCEECKNHFTEVLEYLEELKFPYQINPYLVRGLDYYTKTVFEIFQTGEEEKQLALGGGGRYDQLIKILGGEETPAVGIAFGVERIVQILKEGKTKEVFKKPKIFFAQIGKLGKIKSLQLIEQFRKAKIECVLGLGKESLKSQLKMADKLKVKICLILGQKEALENNIILRNMETGKQEIVPLEKVVEAVKKELK